MTRPDYGGWRQYYRNAAPTPRLRLTKFRADVNAGKLTYAVPHNDLFRDIIDLLLDSLAGGPWFSERMGLRDDRAPDSVTTGEASMGPPGESGHLGPPIPPPGSPGYAQAVYEYAKRVHEQEAVRRASTTALGTQECGPLYRSQQLGRLVRAIQWKTKVLCPADSLDLGEFHEGPVARQNHLGIRYAIFTRYQGGQPFARFYIGAGDTEREIFPGDWIVTNNGMRTPVRDDDFRQHYRLVEDEAVPAP